MKICAALHASEIALHRDWLFDDAREIEFQDFMTLASLTTELDDRVAAAQAALDGLGGLRGIHGPFEGLDIDNKDRELGPLITARFLKALEAEDHIRARQMVLHSPCTAWSRNNLLN